MPFACSRAQGLNHPTRDRLTFSNARIMMTAANAIRKYTAQKLEPLLPMERDGKFVPETVPAFAAQTNFKQVQAAFPGFIPTALSFELCPIFGSN